MRRSDWFEHPTENADGATLSAGAVLHVGPTLCHPALGRPTVMCCSGQREGICKHAIAMILAACLHPRYWEDAQRLEAPPPRAPTPAPAAAAGGGAAAAAAVAAGSSQAGGARRRKLPSSLLAVE